MGLTKFPIVVKALDSNGNVVSTDTDVPHSAIGGQDGARNAKNGICPIFQSEFVDDNMEILVDQDGLVSESNEENNKFTCINTTCSLATQGQITPTVTTGKIIEAWPSAQDIDLEIKSATSSPTDKYTLTIVACNNGIKSLSDIGLSGGLVKEYGDSGSAIGFVISGLSDIKNGQCLQNIITLRYGDKEAFDKNNLNFAIDPYNLIVEKNENNNRLLCRNGACVPPKSTASLDIGIVDARRGDYNTVPGSSPEGKYKIVVRHSSTENILELRGVRPNFGLEIIDTNGDIYQIVSGSFTFFGTLPISEILEIPAGYREIYDRSEKVNIILDPLNIVVETNENNNKISCTGTTCS